MPKLELACTFVEWPVATAQVLLDAPISDTQSVSFSAEENGSLVFSISAEGKTEKFVTQIIRILNGKKIEVEVTYEHVVTEFLINEKKVLSAEEAAGRTFYVESLRQAQQVDSTRVVSFYQGPFDTLQEHNLNMASLNLATLLRKNYSRRSFYAPNIISVLSDMLLGVPSTGAPSIIEAANLLYNLPITFKVVPMIDNDEQNKAHLNLMQILSLDKTDNKSIEVSRSGLLATPIVRIDSVNISIGIILEALIKLFSLHKNNQNINEILLSQLPIENKVVIDSFYKSNLLLNGTNVIIGLLYAVGEIVLEGILPLITAINNKYNFKPAGLPVYPPGAVVYPAPKCPKCGYQFSPNYGFCLFATEDTSAEIAAISLDAQCPSCDQDFTIEMRGFKIEKGVVTLLSGPGITPAVLNRLQKLTEEVIANPAAIDTFKQEANKIQPLLGDKLEEYFRGRQYTIQFFSSLATVIATMVAGLALYNQASTPPSPVVNYNFYGQLPLQSSGYLAPKEKVIKQPSDTVSHPPPAKVGGQQQQKIAPDCPDS